MLLCQSKVNVSSSESYISYRIFQTISHTGTSKSKLVVTKSSQSKHHPLKNFFKVPGKKMTFYFITDTFLNMINK